MKLIWTAFAATQLENLYRFLNNKSETAAVAVYNDILDETERLLHFAEMAPSRTVVVRIYEGISFFSHTFHIQSGLLYN